MNKIPKASNIELTTIFSLSKSTSRATPSQLLSLDSIILTPFWLVKLRFPIESIQQIDYLMIVIYMHFYIPGGINSTSLQASLSDGAPTLQRYKAPGSTVISIFLEVLERFALGAPTRTLQIKKYVYLVITNACFDISN
jgi:hypothetical protein